MCTGCRYHQRIQTRHRVHRQAHGLRIHADAWYDGQNLKNRVEREGVAGWLAELNALDGFRLRIDDWKGEWRCGELEPERGAVVVALEVIEDLNLDRRAKRPRRRCTLLFGTLSKI